MEKCPNCGFEEGWLTGYEIEQKYQITVINTPLDNLCSLICQCGHHAKEHKNPGTAGYCVQCGSIIVHNFIPRESTKQIRFPMVNPSKR